MQRTIPLAICSLLLLTNCSLGRPEGLVCLIDSVHKELQCFDMKKDYDDEGKLKPGAQLKIKPINSMSDLDKGTFFDLQSWSSVSAYIQRVRAKLKTCEAGK